MTSGKISVPQLIGTLTIAIISTAELIIPKDLLKSAGRGAYLSVGITTVLSLLIAWIIGTLMEEYPNHKTIDFFSTLLGKPLGTGLALAYAGFWFLSEISLLRESGDIISIAFLPETPLFVLIISLALLAGYAAYLGLEPVAHYTTFVIPPMTIALLSLVMLNMNHYEFNRLLPVMDKGLVGIFSATVVPLSFEAQISMLLVLSPEVMGVKRRAPLVWTVLFTSLAGELIICALLLYSGDQLPLHYSYPTLLLARNIMIDGVIRGVDAIFMTVLVASIFIKITLWLYIPVKLVGEVFHLQNRSSIVWPIVLLASFLALTSIDNSHNLGYYLNWIWPRFALATFEVGIPVLLLCLAWWKKKSNA